MVGKSEKILVVDDEVRMCDSLNELLSGSGYEVFTAQSADDAISKIKTDQFDLVITDIKMPGKTGLELLKAIKEIDPEIIVILITGYASLESALEAIKEGAFEYHLKPVEFSQLEISVKRGLETRFSNMARMQLVEDLKHANMNLNNRLNEINALYEAGKSLSASSSLQELLEKIVTLASAVTQAEIGSLMLIDKSGEFMTIKTSIGLDKKMAESVRLPLGESIAGYVAKLGEPLIVPDVEKDERFRRINKERYTSSSLLCVPLKISNRVLGVINLANKKESAVFNEHDLKLLTTFASQAAIIIDDTGQVEKNSQKLKEFSVLFELTRQLSTVGSVSAMRKTVFEYLKKLMPVDYSLWFEWNPEFSCLKPVGVAGTDIPLTDTGSINMDVVEENELTVDNIDLSEINLDDIKRLSSYLAAKIANYSAFPKPSKNFTALPVLREGDLKHIFCIGSKCNRNYSTQEISLASLVISHASGFYDREKALLNATRLLTMGNMISEISHDLRKPLTNIRGGLQILRDKWPDIVGNSDFFEMAESEIYRLNELVRELVDFSKPNKYETEMVDLRSVIGRCAELLKPEFGKKNISFKEDFGDCPWEVMINKNQIIEVFLNLFLNAVDAMDEGEIKVIGKIDRPSFKKTDYLAITISDTGCGIKPENVSKIFDRYYTSKSTGTGLGLAVVERIISAHGGTLTVESEYGKGTSFTLYLPL
ncbi:MAG: response regulator [candidate division Zixibacteria bacterium]|nr:response regulator [candidate division Zixibacteria bacterium]